MTACTKSRHRCGFESKKAQERQSADLEEVHRRCWLTQHLSQDGRGGFMTGGAAATSSTDRLAWAVETRQLPCG
jgi:hypothetical protein